MNKCKRNSCNKFNNYIHSSLIQNLRTKLTKKIKTNQIKKNEITMKCLKTVNVAKVMCIIVKEKRVNYLNNAIVSHKWKLNRKKMMKIDNK